MNLQPEHNTPEYTPNQNRPAPTPEIHLPGADTATNIIPEELPGRPEPQNTQS